MKKLNLLLILFLIGCSSNTPQDDFIIEDTPQISKMERVPDTTKSTPTVSQNATTINSAPQIPEKESVLSLLDRNDAQVKRIYRDSTKKITLYEKTAPVATPTPAPVALQKKVAPNIVPAKKKKYTFNRILRHAAPIKKAAPTLQQNKDSDLSNSEKDRNCLQFCGEGYFYDRMGEKNDGEEVVCAKYPLKCGRQCTRGWKIQTSEKNENYTCTEAEQRP